MDANRRMTLNAGIIGAGLLAAPSATLAQSGDTAKLMKAIEAATRQPRAAGRG